MESIGAITTRAFTKKELIEFIEETFGDTPGNIGVITETTVREDDNSIATSQSVTFGLPLKY